MDRWAFHMVWLFRTTSLMRTFFGAFFLEEKIQRETFRAGMRNTKIKMKSRMKTMTKTSIGEAINT
jgi:hypothetical protein